MATIRTDIEKQLLQQSSSQLIGKHPNSTPTVRRNIAWRLRHIRKKCLFTGTTGATPKMRTFVRLRSLGVAQQPFARPTAFAWLLTKCASGSVTLTQCFKSCAYVQSSRFADARPSVQIVRNGRPFGTSALLHSVPRLPSKIRDKPARYPHATQAVKVAARAAPRSLV
jgi:hypothetical protein